MLELIDVGPRSLSAYRGVAPDAVLHDLVRHAEDLRGARVLHVNATPYGGSVSELLRSGVPILYDLGLLAHWKIIRGDDRFFQVTKKVHNGRQGAADGLTETEREAYLGTSRRNAELLEEERLCLPSRSAAGGHSVTPRKRQRPLDLAVPHRHVAAESERVGVPPRLSRAIRRGRVHHGGVRSAGLPYRARRDHATGDRSAQSQEHAARRGHGARRARGGLVSSSTAR